MDFSSRIFYKNIPQKKNDFNYLNIDAWTNKIDPNFYINLSNNLVESRDPRQFNVLSSQNIGLDTSPINGSTQLKDIYQKTHTNYKTGYKSYCDLNDGQIVYYIDKSIEDAFFRPVFSENAKQKTEIFRDPMGAEKIEITRISENKKNPIFFRHDTNCLSFIKDTQDFREDIMSYQQRKNNQFRFTSFYS